MKRSTVSPRTRKILASAEKLGNLTVDVNGVRWDRNPYGWASAPKADGDKPRSERSTFVSLKEIASGIE